MKKIISLTIIILSCFCISVKAQNGKKIKSSTPQKPLIVVGGAVEEQQSPAVERKDNNKPLDNPAPVNEKKKTDKKRETSKPQLAPKPQLQDVKSN